MEIFRFQDLNANVLGYFFPHQLHGLANRKNGKSHLWAFP